jgi:excisionase family DNA binding protein
MSICSTAEPDPKMHAANWGILDARWDGRSTFTVPEAAEILRISKWAAYEAVKNKDLPAVWIGRRCIVPRHVLEKKLSVEA